jgi:hypothetical protein
MATPSADPLVPRRPRKIRIRRVVLALLAVALGAIYVPALFWHPLALEGEAPQDGWTRVSGAIHMHTTYSDGSGSPEELVAAARRLGLQFVVITDHNNFGAKAFEGYHDGVLALVGCELSTRSGHLLGLGPTQPTFRFSGDARDGVDDVLHLGGFPVAAHPFRSGESDWTAWDTPGPWGFELLNGKSQTGGVGLWSRLLAAVRYPVSAEYAALSVAHGSDETLARWDELLAQRDVVGTVGTDAHGRLRLGKRWKSRALPIGSYDAQLGFAREHVLLDGPLTGDAAADGRALLAAMRRGHCYGAVDGLALANEFSFIADAAGRRFTMGDTAPAGPGVSLWAGGRAPHGARFVLLKDGVAVAQDAGHVALPDASAGVYRVEVRVPGWRIPWVLSNPIYVMDEVRARHRQQAATWPDAPLAPPIKTLLDDFEGASSFTAEFDPSSWMDARVLDPRAGINGRGAARFAFRLGAPGPGRPFVWCALVNRAPRDLRGTSGLTFAVRADGEYRIWAQIRDAAATDKDEGSQWWSASVRTSTAWQRVSVPYARLFSLNAAPGSRLDLGRVKALVFVIDSGAANPGASGTIWIDQVGAYE